MNGGTPQNGGQQPIAKHLELLYTLENFLTRIGWFVVFIGLMLIGWLGSNLFAEIKARDVQHQETLQRLSQSVVETMTKLQSFQSHWSTFVIEVKQQDRDQQEGIDTLIVQNARTEERLKKLENQYQGGVMGQIGKLRVRIEKLEERIQRQMSRGNPLFNTRERR